MRREEIQEAAQLIARASAAMQRIAAGLLADVSDESDRNGAVACDGEQAQTKPAVVLAQDDVGSSDGRDPIALETDLPGDALILGDPDGAPGKEPLGRAPIVGGEQPAVQTMPEAWTIGDLRAQLRRQGVALRGYRVSSPADDPLDRLSRDLSDAVSRLGDLPTVLRRAATTTRPQILRLRDEPATVISATTAMASRLHELGLLAHARYDRGARTLHVRHAEAGIAFLCGEWLARVTVTAVDTVLQEARRPGQAFRGVELHLADGTAAAVDVMTRTLDGQLAWAQSYAGAYQEQLTRCVQLRRALHMDPEQCVVVLACASEAACRELSAIHGLTVTTLDGLGTAIVSALTPPCPEAGDCADADAARSSTDKVDLRRGRVADPADCARLGAMLRCCGLRPRPAERRAVLSAVTSVLDGRAHDVRELKIMTAEKAQGSRSAVHDVLAALARGGGLLGAAGTPIASLGEPIARALSDRVDVLEDCCQQAYRAAIRAQDPTAAATDAGEAALRAATGAPQSSVS